MDSVLKAMDLEGTEIRGRLIKVKPRQDTGIFDSAPRHDAQYNDIQRNGLIFDTELNSIECLSASVAHFMVRPSVAAPSIDPPTNCGQKGLGLVP